MIPLAAITAWSNTFPWADQHFVEQDLVLCRVLTELFNDSLIASKLAFRGGTAIHKLYLSPQPRYSEDIDLVQLNPEPIGAVLTKTREILSYLGSPNVKQAQSNNTVIYRFMSESLPNTKLRIKIELNCKEHLNVLGLVSIPFEVQNPWFSGNCGVITYTIDELIGSKIRALYQRKKGRDLFDIYYAHKNDCLDTGKTILCYRKYMEQSVGYVPSAKQYLENLSRKLSDSAFRADMEPLLRPSIEYNIHEAFEEFRKHYIEVM
ncbi:MAG: nucleotidyl transferase AbiEii/AbiGii toxin family protein [Oscillospiraceae bacterium]|nr:nucleotidyl transferase AbiEii/AbiGii toxin family protein [Oscillospiraceae bacterium]